jgi:hypothetical protein
MGEMTTEPSINSVEQTAYNYIGNDYDLKLCHETLYAGFQITQN